MFAIADLHLSEIGAKPMAVFGELWRDHATRIAEAWDDRVEDGDTVLVPGDVSWARNSAEVLPDLDWLRRRPGRKLLLRGNHDSWWSSVSRARALLPAGCEALHNDSHEVGEWIVVGARGWLAPDDPAAQAGDERVFRRELGRLKASVAHADARFGRQRPRLAMLHYPPWLEGRAPTEVVEVLKRAGVRVCLYGHLHGEDHLLAVRGEREGLCYYFVAADAVDFAPLEIPLHDLAKRHGESCGRS